MSAKPDRNDPCPCGSGKKYKKCCYGNEMKKMTAKLIDVTEASAVNRVGSSLMKSVGHQQAGSAKSGSDAPHTAAKAFRKFSSNRGK